MSYKPCKVEIGPKLLLTDGEAAHPLCIYIAQYWMCEPQEPDLLITLSQKNGRC